MPTPISSPPGGEFVAVAPTSQVYAGSQSMIGPASTGPTLAQANSAVPNSRFLIFMLHPRVRDRSRCKRALAILRLDPPPARGCGRNRLVQEDLAVDLMVVSLRPIDFVSGRAGKCPTLPLIGREI